MSKPSIGAANSFSKKNKDWLSLDRSELYAASFSAISVVMSEAMGYPSLVEVLTVKEPALN
jgi:hypothetical protein